MIGTPCTHLCKPKLQVWLLSLLRAKHLDSQYLFRIKIYTHNTHTLRNMQSYIFKRELSLSKPWLTQTKITVVFPSFMEIKYIKCHKEKDKWSALPFFSGYLWRREQKFHDFFFYNGLDLVRLKKKKQKPFTQDTISAIMKFTGSITTINKLHYVIY